MIYDIIRWIVIITGYPFFWLYFKLKVFYVNKEVSRNCLKGKTLIVSNHYSYLDYVVNLMTILPRKLYVVAAEFVFKRSITRFAINIWGGIQANRITKSMKFVDESVKVLNRGKLVQIFPEAHNTPDGNMKHFYAGYISIALKAKAPIVLIISDGNYGFFKRVHAIVSEPIDVYDYLEGETFTRQDVYRINEIVYQKALELRKELDRRINFGKGKK